jgi:hypothetical protein
MKLLSRTVKRFAMEESEDIIKELEVVKAHMKYGFDQGILNRIPCIAHNISHGLEEELDASEHTDSEVQYCNGCRHLYYTFKRIALCVSSNLEVEDCPSIVTIHQRACIPVVQVEGQQEADKRDVNQSQTEEENSQNNSPRKSAKTAIEDCLEKAKLFLGHSLRVVNQQKAIRKILKKMQRACLKKVKLTNAFLQWTTR